MGTKQFNDSKQNILLRKGSYGNGKTEFKDFSRTFSFFWTEFHPNFV